MKKSCDKVSRLVSDSMERSLSWVERIEVAVHLSMCDLCKNYANNMRILRDVFAYIRHSDESRVDNKLSQASKRKLQAVLKREMDEP